MTYRLLPPPLHLLLITAAFVLSGCAQPSAAASRTAVADQAMDRLRAAIGPARCDSDAQCRTVPIGHRACGGPQAYLAWSTQDADPTTVLRLADAYTQAQRAAEQPDRMSICSVVPDPGAVCAPAAGGARRCSPAQGVRQPLVR